MQQSFAVLLFILFEDVPAPRSDGQSLLELYLQSSIWQVKDKMKAVWILSILIISCSAQLCRIVDGVCAPTSEGVCYFCGDTETETCVLLPRNEGHICATQCEVSEQGQVFEIQFRCDANGVCTNPQFVNCGNTGDLCNPTSCDEELRTCLNAPVECEQTDLCQTYECDPSTGECVGTPIECEQTNPCFLSVCNPNNGECERQREPIDCEQPDPCRTYACIPSQGGCVDVGPIRCERPDRCQTYRCDPNIGECVGTPIVCNQPDPCQTYECDPQLGCVGTPIECEQTEPCQTFACDSTTGECVGTPIECESAGPCETGVCNPQTGQCEYSRIEGCCVAPIDCVEFEEPPARCYEYDCIESSCTQVRVGGDNCCLLDADCDDGLVCTEDVCDFATGDCSNLPIITDPPCCGTAPDCPDRACFAKSCENNQCVYTPAPSADCCFQDTDCDDENPCTTGTCNVETNECTYEPIDGCCQADADCDDANPCTSGSCDIETSKCSYEEIDGCCLDDADCEDSNKCTIDLCDPDSNVCSYDPVSCDDKNPCTADACDPAEGCMYEKQKCTKCTKDFCYWMMKYDRCNKTLYPEYPTTFCGLTEDELIDDAMYYDDALGVLRKAYLVSLNNMACRNNHYDSNHLAWMDYARDLLESTCDAVYPADGCDRCGRCSKCSKCHRCEKSLFDEFVKVIYHVSKYTQKNLCTEKHKCDSHRLKSGDKPEASYGDAYAKVMEAAGYVYNEKLGIYEPPSRSSFRTVASSAPLVAGLVIGGLILAGVLAFVGYRHRRLFQHVADGGTATYEVL